MAIKVEIKGLEQLKRALAVAPMEMKTELSKAIKMSAFRVETESKKVTPVDTGRLRASISSEISLMKAIVSPHTDYALPVHEGTRGMRGRPFMRWGVEAAGKEIESFFKQAINKVLKGIAFKTKI